MPTRRKFLTQCVSTGAALAAGLRASESSGAIAPTSSSAAIEVAGRRIKSAIRRDETTLRLGGMGDNFHMSWAGDDRQCVALCDGLGWAERPKEFHNSRLYTIAGGPHDAVFQEVAGYPALTSVLNTDNMMRYYGFGTLAIDGCIYQFLSTPNHQFSRNFFPWPGARFVGVKLIYSMDNGVSWRNQDGSAPVIWERWEHRSRTNMVFFEEARDAFSLLSVMQMGRNYKENKDGYVYVYSPNGSVDGLMNELVMFRVPKAQVLSRSAYEYFGGLRGGRARWVRDISDRAVVHTFPRGWVNIGLHPWAWMPSVTFNAPLGMYMMANWGTGCGPDGTWFSRPSYLGLWVSVAPWGPWEQVYEDSAWMPQGDTNARAFAPQISPKWVAKDGKSFWLVWADYQSNATNSETEQLKLEASRVTSSEETVRYFQRFSRTRPYYAFNAQRVDLV